MQVGKVYFVHIREQDAQGEYVNNSGATIAYYADLEGRLYVGKPAVCHKSDTFRKDKGREIAEHYLNTEDAVLVLHPEHLKCLATAQAVNSMNYKVLTPAARLELFEALEDGIERDICGVMNVSWFEGLIRARFSLEDGHLRADFDGPDMQDTFEMINGALIHTNLEDSVYGVLDLDVNPFAETIGG